MAHQTLNACLELQKFDVNFDAVESGSMQFNAERAAATVVQRGYSMKSAAYTPDQGEGMNGARDRAFFRP